VIPHRERLHQLARLVGSEAFVARFGPPDSAEPDREALHALIDEHCDEIAARLVDEAAASDDVIDPESAQAYVDDRLRTFDDLLTPEQAERLRTAFAGKTSGW
jgi:hypothetical protein